MVLLLSIARAEPASEAIGRLVEELIDPPLADAQRFGDLTRGLAMIDPQCERLALFGRQALEDIAELADSPSGFILLSTSSKAPWFSPSRASWSWSG